MPSNYSSRGYETLTIAGTAVGLTGGVTGAKSFIGVLETAQVRYNKDGSTPTSSEGVLLEVGQPIILSEGEINTCLFIRTGSVRAF